LVPSTEIVGITLNKRDLQHQDRLKAYNKTETVHDDVDRGEDRTDA